MSSECTDYFRMDVPITTLHGKLKSHVIIYNPPYDIKDILSNYRCDSGVCIKIDIEHSTRHVNMVQIDGPSVSTLVTATAVYAFQAHRLQPSRESHYRIPVRPISREYPYQIPVRPISRESPYRIPIQSVVPSQIPRPVGQQTGKTCSICMEPIFSVNLRVLQCAHLFHDTCIDRWALETALSPSCPVCRTPLTK